MTFTLGTGLHKAIQKEHSVQLPVAPGAILSD